MSTENDQGKMPSISVVMATHNRERFLKEAIESILGQSLKDLEFIIVNDGSTDKTEDILESYKKLDSRIKVHYQKHQGLIKARSLGYKEASGKYLAHMDDDDISLPDRLIEQYRYMESHPGISILGTQVKFIDEDGCEISNSSYPVSPGLIGWSLLFKDCLVNSTVLMRREIIGRIGGYDLSMIHSEDYDLWSRASFTAKIANLPQILLKYRIWKGSISSEYGQRQLQNTVKITRSSVSRLIGEDISAKTAENLHRILFDPPLDNLDEIRSTTALVQHIHMVYIGKTQLSVKEKREVARDTLSKLCSLVKSANRVSRSGGAINLFDTFKFMPFWLSALAFKNIIRYISGAVLAALKGFPANLLVIFRIKIINNFTAAYRFTSKNPHFKIVISAHYFGGIGGVERLLKEIVESMPENDIYIFSKQILAKGFIPRTRNYHLNKPLNKKDKYDVYIYLKTADPVYLGKDYDFRKKMIITNGNHIFYQEHLFDYVVSEGKNCEKFYTGLEKTMVMLPSVTVPVKYPKKVRGLPKKFLLTVFNPVNALKGTDLLFAAAKYSKLPIIWCYDDTTFLKGLGGDIVLPENIIRFKRLPQNKLYYLYNRAEAYVSFSRSESFGFSIADAFMYDLPIISKNIGIVTFINEQDGIYIYDDETELKEHLGKDAFIKPRYDKSVLSRYSYKDQIESILK